MNLETKRAAAVFAAGFCTFVNLYAPQAFLPSLTADLKTSPTQAGLSITVCLLAVAVMAPIAGALSDRLGRKRIVTGACMLLILPTLMAAASTGLASLLVARTLQGMLLPFIFTVTVAYVADECSGPQTIKISGLYASGTIFGGFMGRFIGGLVSDAAGWRAVFLVLATITAVAGAFVAWSMPREQKFRPILGGITTTLAAYRDHLGNGRLLATCAIGFGMLFSTVATFTFVNFHLAQPPFSLSNSSLGSVFAVYLLGMITTPLATRVAVGIGRPRALLAALAISATGILLSLSAFLPVVIGGLALVTSGLFIVQALSLGFIGSAVPRARSSAVGLYVTTFYIGGAVGGVAPGWLWHHADWPGVVGLILAVLVTMATFGWTAWRRV